MRCARFVLESLANCVRTCRDSRKEAESISSVRKNQLDYSFDPNRTECSSEKDGWSEEVSVRKTNPIHESAPTLILKKSL